MSLQSRLSTLITAIGADIKSLNNRQFYNASTADQTGTSNFSTDSILVGSLISIPQGKVQIGTKYKLKFRASKTGAGTGAPKVEIRVGTAGTVADTSRATVTFGASTGVLDEMECEVEFVIRTAGASAVARAIGRMVKRLNTATGWGPTPTQTIVSAASGTFDATLANLKISASFFSGTSAVATVQHVSAELVNLAP